MKYKHLLYFKPFLKLIHSYQGGKLNFSHLFWKAHLIKAMLSISEEIQRQNVHTNKIWLCTKRTCGDLGGEDAIHGHARGVGAPTDTALVVYGTRGCAVTSKQLVKQKHILQCTVHVATLALMLLLFNWLALYLKGHSFKQLATSICLTKQSIYVDAFHKTNVNNTHLSWSSAHKIRQRIINM